MSEDPFAPLGGRGRTPSSRGSKPARIVVLPVPKGAPRPPATHPILGKPSATWTYPDVTGAVLGYALRFDTPQGKEFRPLTCWQPTAGGALEWRWEAWPPKRPLYGLQGLAERPAAPVVVCEGEKAADAATGLLPGFVAATSPNGSQSAHKADWQPLCNKRVVIWPDADPAGARYADEAAEQIRRAGAESVAIVEPPDGFVVIAKRPSEDERATDWTALRGRRVVIWPEADLAYADEIAKQIEAAHAASVMIESRPSDGIEGWDAADALAQGWDESRAVELVSAARPAEQFGKASARVAGTDDAGDTGRRRRNPQRNVLIGLTEFCELWHDPNKIAYVTLPMNHHLEHWPIRSDEFETWLSGRFYDETGGAIGSQQLQDAIRVLKARAIHHGPQYETFIRVGRHGGKLYLDLCDSGWRAVEIGPDGWRIVDRPPIKFLRSPAMRELPEPEGGYQIEELRRFVNVSDEDFALVPAFLVAALRDRGPYPILIVNGEHGAGKSFFCQMLRALIDPNIAPVRSAPMNERDLIVSAINSWVLVFDNLSSVSTWPNKTPGFSDALCRLASHGGFATRALHTDRGEMIFNGARPIILNGINTLTDRADLANRSITLHLGTIPDERRRAEDELWAEFEAVRPRVLGVLLDGVSAALRNIDKVKLDRLPRMADFEKWNKAAESALGLEEGAFERAYTNPRDV